MNTKGKVGLAINHIESIMLERGANGENRLPSERTMAEMLGVSRPTVREAIQRLSSRGKLEIRQGSGIYIAQGIKPMAAVSPWQQLLPDDAPSAGDVTEFRLVHTCLISRLAAKNANDGDIEALDRIISRIRNLADNEDFEALAACYEEFHDAVAEAAHNAMVNQFLKKFRSTIHGHAEQHIVRAAENVDGRDIWLRDFVLVHESLYCAISKHDLDAAELATIRHVEFLETLPEHAGT